MASYSTGVLEVLPGRLGKARQRATEVLLSGRAGLLVQDPHVHSLTRVDTMPAQLCQEFSLVCGDDEVPLIDGLGLRVSTSHVLERIGGSPRCGD